MRKRSVAFLFFIFAIAVSLAFAGCAPSITGLEIATQPAKTAYVEGETFDAAGMVVKLVYSDSTSKVITDYTVDKTGPLTLSDNKVTVSYGEFTAEVTITVSPAVVETGIEVTTQPAKTAYIEGETFDAAGMVVKLVYSDSTSKVITDYTVDKTGPLTLSDNKVTVSYGEFTAEVTITVSPAVTGVEVQPDESAYYRTMAFEALNYRNVYSDGTKGGWNVAENFTVTGYSADAEKVTVNVDVTAEGKTWQTSFELQITPSITVSELLTKPADGETVYELEGVLVAVASTMRRVEYILMDPESGAFIGVAGITSTGSMFDGDYLPRFEVGDKVEFPVTLVQTETKANNSDSDKIYASFAGGSIWETGVVEKDVEYTVDYSAATEISDQQGLEAFLGASARSENHYKLVKLNGPLSVIRYGTTPAHYRFYYGTLSFANHKIDGVSPVFMNSNQQYITGNTVGELLAGDAYWAPADWNNPGQAYKDVYALFIGGNAYYHEFIILSSDAVTPAVPKLEEIEFVAPEKFSYNTGEKLDLTGGEIVYRYNFGENTVVPLTIDMLDASTVPDMSKGGNFTVKGSYNEFEFSFEIVVVPQSAELYGIELAVAPQVTTYSHRDGIDTIDLTGGRLKLVYTDESVLYVPLLRSMLPETESPDWKLGVVTYTITYEGFTTDMDITYENRALSVKEFLTKTEGEYDVTGIMVGPISSFGAAELLLKDTATMDIVGIYNSGIAGKYNAISLDTSVVDVGDEVIVKLSCGQVISNGGSKDKYYGNAVNVSTFTENLIVVSKDNEVKFDFAETAVTEISTQEQLTAFLNNENRFYTYVKFTGLKAVNNNGSLRFFFGDAVTDFNSQKINGYSPYIYHINSNYYLSEGHDKYFVNFQSTDYANPVTTEYEIYALFVGGNGFYHCFAILEDSWFVNQQAQA